MSWKLLVYSYNIYLQRIHEVQVLINDKEAWESLTQEQRQAKTRQLTADERQCRYTYFVFFKNVKYFLPAEKHRLDYRCDFIDRT